MRKTSWVILAILGTTACAQERIALKYTPYPPSRIVGGRSLDPTIEETRDVAVPAGFAVQRKYAINFGGSTRDIVIGTYHGEAAVVVDTDGQAHLSHAKPYSRKKGDSRFDFFGPFTMHWTVAGRKWEGLFRVVVVRPPTGPGWYMFCAAGSPAGHGTVLGRAASVRFHDEREDGGSGIPAPWIEIDWGKERASVMLHGGLGIGDRFAKFKVDRSATYLETVPVHPKTRHVHVACEAVVAGSNGATGLWYIEGARGVLDVPAGTQLLWVEATRTHHGKKWTLSLSRTGNPVQPRPGSSVVFAIEPLKVGLTQDNEGAERTYSLDLQTHTGWKVSSLTVDRRQPPEPVLELLAADGSLVGTAKFSYG